jgi:hypothetical protein
MSRRSRATRPVLAVLLAAASLAAPSAAAAPVVDPAAMLLEVSALPPGYSQGTVTGSSDLPCGGPDLTAVAPVTDAAARSFDGVSGEPTVFQQVIVYPDAAEAADVQAAVRQAAVSCSRYETVEPDDPADAEAMVVRSEVTRPPEVGVPAVAVRTAEPAWVVHRVFMRRGAVLVVLAAGTDGGGRDAAALIDEVAPRVEPLLALRRSTQPHRAAGVPIWALAGALAILSVAAVAMWRRRPRRDPRPPGSPPIA